MSKDKLEDLRVILERLDERDARREERDIRIEKMVVELLNYLEILAGRLERIGLII